MRRGIPRPLLSERRCQECGATFARHPDDGGASCGVCVAGLQAKEAKTA